MSLPNSQITPIPNNEPDAVPNLWNTRYLEIDENFSNLDGRQTSVENEIAGARRGNASLGETVNEIVGQLGGLASEQETLVSPALFGRAYNLEMAYSDEGFDFELFATATDSLSFRDFDSVAVTNVTNGDDTLEVADTGVLREGMAYVLSDSSGRFIEEFEVDRILTQTRLIAKANFSHTYTTTDNASVRRSNFVVNGGTATVRHNDRLYSRVLKALEHWDKGRLVLRRSASGVGLFGVQYRAADTDSWADAEWLGNTTREAGTRDEEFEIGIGGNIELRITYTGAQATDTETLNHIVLFTPPRAETLSVVQRPTNVSPTNEQTNMGETPVLTGSAFRSIYDLSQAGAQFQVADDQNFDNLIVNTSTDYLASWLAIAQSETIADLNALAMHGTGLGLAVGAGGDAVSTSDAGLTWSAETTGTASALHCAHHTANMRLAGGAGGTLIQSTHDGSAWQAWAALSPVGGFVGAIRGVAAVGANLVFVGDNGVIQTSSDGGTFFVARTAANGSTAQFNALAMDGAGNCVAVGAGGTIQTSNDFGVTWAARNADNSYTGAFLAVAMTEQGGVLIAGENGEVQTSTDYGATWTRRTTAGSGSFTGAIYGVEITSDGNAIIVGATGEIQTSDDNGVTWYAREAGGAYAGTLMGVDINADGEAVMVGTGAEIQRANRLDMATTTYTVPSGADMLQTGQIYWWRARYQDADGNWSPWSEPTAFATAAVFNYVAQPATISPASGSLDVSLTPTLQGSAFAFVGETVTHAKSQWQIASESNFAAPVYNSGESDDLISHAVPGGAALSVEQSYFWRVRYKDSAGRWSAWSTVAAFVTQSKPSQPSITAPSDGATGILETPTLTSSAFSVPVFDTHIASQWRISDTSGDYASPIWDSGEVASLTSAAVPSGNLSDGATVYYVQVRHRGNELGWSDWSEESSFTTAASFASVIGLVLATPGGGAGTWQRIDEAFNNATTDSAFFNTHPTYAGIVDEIVETQAMVKIPKFWFRAGVVPSGAHAGKTYWQIADAHVSGFAVHPMFADGAGGWRDHVWVGKYQGTNDNGTKLGSASGTTPLVNLTFPTMQARANARNIGGVTGFRLLDYHMLGGIQMLASIEIGGADSQSLIGQGHVSGSSALNTDNATVAQATWRGMVGLWGNVWQMVDGLKRNSGKWWMWNPGTQTYVDTGLSDVQTSGYPVTINTSLLASNGVILPATVDGAAGNGSTGDYFYSNTSTDDRIAYHGGSWGHGADAGLFCLSVYYVPASGGANIGARLAKV